MTLNADALRADFDIIEQVEKATLRMVVQAIYDFRDDAIEIFAGESDWWPTSERTSHAKPWTG